MPVVRPISNLESNGKGPMDERLSKSETGVLNGSSRLPSLSLLNASQPAMHDFRRNVFREGIGPPRVYRHAEVHPR